MLRLKIVTKANKKQWRTYSSIKFACACYSKLLLSFSLNHNSLFSGIFPLILLLFCFSSACFISVLVSKFLVDSVFSVFIWPLSLSKNYSVSIPAFLSEYFHSPHCFWFWFSLCLKLFSLMSKILPEDLAHISSFEKPSSVAHTNHSFLKKHLTFSLALSWVLFKFFMSSSCRNIELLKVKYRGSGCHCIVV